MANPHAPVFISNEEIDLSLDEQSLIRRFRTEDERREYVTNWMARAVVLERRLNMESLPTLIANLFRDNGWHGVPHMPISFQHVNRSIVREFYACVATTELNERCVIVRGVPVVLNNAWINNEYDILEYPQGLDFFQPPDVPELLQPDMAVLFGETHLWKRVRRTRPSPWSWRGPYLPFLITFLATNMYGTVNYTLPSFDLYSLAYASITSYFDVGEYILSRIRQIAKGNAGDGYIFFPYLITAMCIRSAGVPEYAEDDVSYGHHDDYIFVV